MQAQLTARSFDDQIARGIGAHLAGPINREPDRPGVSPRRDNEIVFELLLVSVIHQVDTGVDSPLGNLAVIGHVRVPLLRVPADKIVAPARQFVQTRQFGRRTAAYKTHSHQGGSRPTKVLPFGASRAGGRRERQHRFSRGQKQRVAAAAR